MSKKVTAKRPNSANNVSHAKNVTKRKKKLNLQLEKQEYLED